MIITLFKAERIYSLTLPQKIKGQYWIADYDKYGQRRELVSVEADEGSWYMQSNRNVQITGTDFQPVKSIKIEEMNFYKIQVRQEEESGLLYTEKVTTDRKVYRKYCLDKKSVITIGRNTDNDICFQNKFMSGYHAKLIFDGVKWNLTDLESRNGIFVNEYRSMSVNLNPSDIIFVMGMKIVIGKDFIAVNNPDGCVKINENVLVPYVPQKPEDTKTEWEEAKEYFYRSPRFKRDIIKKEFRIDDPPAPQKVDTVPPTLMLGPSLTMGMASLTTAGFTVFNMLDGGRPLITAAPTLAMSASMLMGTVLWPVLTKKSEKKQKRAAEVIRQNKYRQYLQGIRDEIIKECALQSGILHENNISLKQCEKRILDKERNLWERMIAQDDFLELRLGIGDIPLQADVKYSEKRFSMEDDNLKNDMLALATEPKMLQSVPITYSLTQEEVSGIIGPRNKVKTFIQGLLLRIVALHSYDEVKIVLLLEKSEVEQYGFARFIPHMWDAEKNIRYMASGAGEAKELSAYLEKIYLAREEQNRKSYKECVPYYVIISENKELSDKMEIVSMIQRQAGNYGFSFISACEELRNLPKECSMVIDLNEEKARLYDKDDLSGKQIIFAQDMPEGCDLEAVSDQLANTCLDNESRNFSLPGMLTFLEMFDVGKIEHLNPLKRWKENNPAISLQTPVGVDTMGERFYLDLHEKMHGPHGLVAGMTGSGKSEFIITYILSMAVNYHPDEVAFILIDYKGGGLTGAFENAEKGIRLPHLAGTITNLDGAAVKRSLISIQSELRRRQAVFNDARRIANEGTMDIYKYQKLYRNGIVKEPVPHLFIISDEFAELKTQQQEFMEQLISAARIGRSLGVHLILATQKPSGVVDDQIWSNSRFRVCLKVQEKADSMDMIKRPDAAEIASTGRFYLQVGFNELFEMGQSAWSGAPYVPSDKVDKKEDDSVEVVDILGRVIKEVKPRRQEVKAEYNQVVGIVQYLSDLAGDEGIAERPLWLPPMAEVMTVKQLLEKYPLEEAGEYILAPAVGEMDDPFNQKQICFNLPISREGNAVIYGSAGSGKTTFITTMLWQLLSFHTARTLHAYVLDFGSETMTAFRNAPQVGGVILSSETEKVINLFKMLREEVTARKKSFADYGGDYLSYCASSGKVLPNIVVIIHNFAAFSELYENCEEILSYLTREGTKYGIYFVLTAANTNAVRYRLLQNFKQLLVMQLNDKTDYAGILGNTEGTYPSPVKGRGILKKDKVYEFQTACISDGENLAGVIGSFCKQLSEENNAGAAKPVPVLPDEITYENFRYGSVSVNNLPIGIDKHTLETVTWNLAGAYINLVGTQDGEGAESFLQGMAEEAANLLKIPVVVLDAENCFVPQEARYEYCSSDLEAKVVELFHLLVQRNNEYKAGVASEFERILYIIPSLSGLFSRLSADGADKLKVLLEKGENIYNVNFIIGDAGNHIQRFSMEAWYKKHLVGNGLWIGNGVADQYQIKISRITSELTGNLPQDFGIYAYKGRPRVVKLLLCTKKKEAEDI